MVTDATPAPRVKGVLIQGVPDDRMAKLAFDGRGPPKVVNRGTASFANFMGETMKGLPSIWLGPPRGAFEVSLQPAPLINYIADADLCRIALDKAALLAERAGQPCFNHPLAVLRTTRDQVAQRLAGVPGLTAPRTIRAQAQSLGQLAKAIDAAGLRYPVLVRIAGDHGGTTLAKIESARTLSDVARAGLLGRSLYVTEFRDFRSPDGRYRKYRIAVVGGRPLLRHVLIGDHWLLHAERRGEDTAAEEAERIERFDAEQLPQTSAALAAIDQRIGLDYFGVDCAIDADGAVVLFEANACMNIVQNSVRSPNMWDEPIRRIRRRLFNVLLRPEAWRGPPGTAPSA